MLAFLFEAQKFTSRHPTNLPPLERCWHPKLQNAASSRTRSTAGAYGATAFKASKPRGTEFCFSKISFTFKASLVKSEQFRKEFQLLKFWFWEQQHISYNHIYLYIYIYIDAARVVYVQFYSLETNSAKHCPTVRFSNRGLIQRHGSLGSRTLAENCRISRRSWKNRKDSEVIQGEDDRTIDVFLNVQNTYDTYRDIWDLFISIIIYIYIYCAWFIWKMFMEVPWFLSLVKCVEREDTDA